MTKTMRSSCASAENDLERLLKTSVNGSKLGVAIGMLELCDGVTQVSQVYLSIIFDCREKYSGLSTCKSADKCGFADPSPAVHDGKLKPIRLVQSLECAEFILASNKHGASFHRCCLSVNYNTQVNFSKMYFTKIDLSKVSLAQRLPLEARTAFTRNSVAPSPAAES